MRLGPCRRPPRSSVLIPLGLFDQRATGIFVTDALGDVLAVNRTAADLLGYAHLLELLGHEVTLADDGPGALAEAAAMAPELVLLDLGLPGMDGYAVAVRLRGAGHEGPQASPLRATRKTSTCAARRKRGSTTTSSSRSTSRCSNRSSSSCAQKDQACP